MLADPVTFEGAKESVEFHALPSVFLKGQQQRTTSPSLLPPSHLQLDTGFVGKAIDVYRPMSMKGPAAGIESPLAPLVGRRREWATLMDSVNAVWRGRKG